MEALPDETLLSICFFLAKRGDQPGLSALAITCRRLASVALDPAVWRALFEARWVPTNFCPFAGASRVHWGTRRGRHYEELLPPRSLVEMGVRVSPSPKKIGTSSVGE